MKIIKTLLTFSGFSFQEYSLAFSSYAVAMEPVNFPSATSLYLKQMPIHFKESVSFVLFQLAQHI